MSGTASASIVGREALELAQLRLDRGREREADAVQELERVLAHHDEQLRLDDPQLAPQPLRGHAEVAARELDAVRAVDLHRVDVEPPQRLDQRGAGAAVEGDAFLQLLCLRAVLEQEDVRQRVPGGQGGGGPVRGLRDLLRQPIDLGDRLTEVALVDLVCRHGGGHAAARTFSPSGPSP